MSSIPRIGLIVCSQRTPRVGPQVADVVTSIISSHQDTLHPYELTRIDLKEWNLPIFDEPVVPADVPANASYVGSHTLKWSAEVQWHDAFIFVCPQYNWGYPASVKNAIDYLYSEWKGKAGLIISYGNRGGGRAAEQLRQVLLGVRMKVTETMPALAFKTEENLKVAAGEGILTTQVKETWIAEEETILKAFQELQALLVAVDSTPAH